MMTGNQVIYDSIKQWFMPGIDAIAIHVVFMAFITQRTSLGGVAVHDPMRLTSSQVPMMQPVPKMHPEV